MHQMALRIMGEEQAGVNSTGVVVVGEVALWVVIKEPLPWMEVGGEVVVGSWPCCVTSWVVTAVTPPAEALPAADWPVTRVEKSTSVFL